MVVPLSCLNPGQQGLVVWIAADPEQERRLTEIGFAPDSPVLCLAKGAPRCMSTYLAGGAVFGLRERDAQTVLVRV